MFRVVALALVLLAGALAAASAAEEKPAAATGSPANWLSDLAEAGRQSRLSGRPVLALSNLRACPWCLKFEDTLADPTVAPRLHDFVLLKYSIEDDVPIAQALGVEAAPVVVILSPSGSALARQEGYLPAPEFLRWLDGLAAQAALASPQALAGRSDGQLVALLAERDAVLREAAITALCERGHAPPVVEALASGGLSARLGALEVLTTWGAPVEGADPWKPDTVPPALERLRAWAATAKVGPAGAARPEEVARDLDLWTTGEDGPATLAAYERLARAGRDLLPQVRARTPDTWDLSHERLTALRYRLLLPAATVRQDPQLPFRMAAADPGTRVQTMAALAEHADPALKDFFFEALSDPDGKVREAALRGLSATKTEFARAQVAALLADPSPEVRASVLQELARAPRVELLDDLVAYAEREQEEDLVVQAARALRELRDQDKAFDELIKLAAHQSWRVRAEAIEAFGSVSTSSSSRMAEVTARHFPQLLKALKAALKDQDPFVVAKAVETLTGLEAADVGASLNELAEAARQHPELAVSVLQVIESNESLRVRGLALVREFCASPNAELRAAALVVLARIAPAGGAKQFLAGLSDPEPSVRKAAAGAVLVAAGRAVPFTAKEQQDLAAAAKTMASAADTAERFAGLSALATLGQGDLALPGLEEIATKDPAYAAELPTVMAHVEYAQRKQLFKAAMAASLDQRAWTALFAALAKGAPRSDEAFIWQIVEEDPHVPAAAQAVLESVLESYGIESGLWYMQETTTSAAAALARQAKAHLDGPDPVRRAMALVLLCRADRVAGLTQAAALTVDAAAPEDLRRTATELVLASSESGADLAVEKLGEKDERLRHAAAAALIGRYSPFRQSPSVDVGAESVMAAFISRSSSSVIVSSTLSADSGVSVWQPPRLPAGLTPELLRGLAAGQDRELALGASYLLVLKGDASGLAALVDAWRLDTSDYELREALPKAVAALGDDANVKYAREVYAAFDANERQYRASGLYSSIRRMDGPEAQALRKQMRQDLGPAVLR